MVDRERSRRRFLRTSAGLLVVGAAGCLSRGSEAAPTPTPGDATPTEVADSDTPSPAPTSASNDAPDWPHRRRDLANTARAPAEAAPEPTDLSREWRYATRNNRMNIPLLSGDLLVASARSPNADVFGLDADTGDERWVSRSQGLLRYEPALVSGSVFAARTFASNDSIRRVHGALPTPSIGVASIAVLRSYGETLLLGGKRSGTYEVLGIAPGATDPDWRFQCSFDWGDINDLALRDGVLYVVTVGYEGDTASGPNSIRAFDVESGEEVWNHREEGLVGSIAVGTDAVYAFSRMVHGSVALDREDGEVLWRADTNAPGGGFSYPAVGPDLVYMGRGTSLAAFDRSSGEREWETDLGATTVSPSIGGDVVYATASNLTDRPATFAAINAGTGEKLFETELGDVSLTAPVIANGAAYFGASDGSVHRYA